MKQWTSVAICLAVVCLHALQQAAAVAKKQPNVVIGTQQWHVVQGLNTAVSKQQVRTFAKQQARAVANQQAVQVKLLANQQAAAAAKQQAETVVNQQGGGIQGPDGDKVVVHLFEWSWKDIERECEDLAKWGYWGVQVSPPQEDIAGSDHWWARYQPVSYQLCSRSGSEQEFASMVATCKSHGVNIIVDAVINHMANHGDGTGRCGTVMHSKCSYEGGYQCEDFHQLGCPGEGCGAQCKDCINCEGVNCQGGNPDHVYTCNLVGLPDLNTSREGVQDRIAGYFNHLVDLGVAGVRIDAAKHIKPSELSAILGKVKAPGLYVNQETTLTGDCACVHREDYVMNGKLWEFNVPSLFNDIFKKQDLNDMSKIRDMDSSNPGGWLCGWTHSDLAHTFVVNHDRLVNPHERTNTVTMFDEGIYRLALITLLSHPYGQPNILSSINFDYNTWDQKAPTASVFPDGCGYWKDHPMKPYACEHRWPEVRNMVAWRKAAGMSGAEPLLYAEGDIFAMTRGDNNIGKAFVAINRGLNSRSYTFDAKMPTGQYCSIVAQGSGVEDCYPCKITCAYQVTVGDDGRVQVDLGARQAVAFHSGSMLPSPSIKDGPFQMPYQPNTAVV